MFGLPCLLCPLCQVCFMTSIKGWESSLWPSHQGMGIYPHIMSKSHIYMLYYLNGILRQAQDDIVMVSLMILLW
jgi:hypothetical protein